VTSEISDLRARTVGVVGLGAIGGHVARAIARAGWRVLGHDIRPEAFQQFPEARPAASARALADAAETVLVAVYDDDQLRAALWGPEGVLSSDQRPITLCVLSTITLSTLRWAAAEAGRRGMELIDCGVTGGMGLRTEGKIVVLAGGPKHTVERVRPALEAFADPLLHMGPLGAGMQAKLARNLMHYSGWYAAWEAARIAAACGIDVQKLVEAHLISNQRSGGGATNLLTRGIGPGPADPADKTSMAARRQSAAFAKKDLSYVLELAHELGIPLPGAELVRARIDLVVGLAAEERAAHGGEVPSGGRGGSDHPQSV
jgi:3-hydroxyisobutyrate dehydrogenase